MSKLKASSPRHPHKNLQLDQQLCFAMYSATHAMTRSYKRALTAVGLTYPQYLVMLVLWEHDGIGISQIAKTLALDTPSVTPLVRRLELAGWLKRVRVPGDDRISSMKVQPKGWAIQKQVAEIQKTMACRSGLEGAEFNRLKASLLEVAAHMNQAPDTGRVAVNLKRSAHSSLTYTIAATTTLTTSGPDFRPARDRLQRMALALQPSDPVAAHALLQALARVDAARVEYSGPQHTGPLEQP